MTIDVEASGPEEPQDICKHGKCALNVSILI